MRLASELWENRTQRVVSHLRLRSINESHPCSIAGKPETVQVHWIVKVKKHICLACKDQTMVLLGKHDHEIVFILGNVQLFMHVTNSARQALQQHPAGVSE